jgi:octaprenyl-diphosphate synthase
VKEVIDFVKAKGGLDYAKTVMNNYYTKAITGLDDFPESTYKTSLLQLVQFTIERKN